jgi:hypothetical protein
MNIVPQTFTVTTSPIQVKSTPTPCCKIIAQMKIGGVGIGFIGLYSGSSAMDNSGNNAIAELSAASSTSPGGAFSIETQDNSNALDASQYAVHGANAGDVIRVTYHTA